MKIERHTRKTKFYLAGILGVCAMAAAFLTVNVTKSTALSQARPESVTSFGYATVQPFVPGIGHDGQIRNIPSINAIGDLIAFSFFATKDEMGRVQGEMILFDFTQKMVITSDVVSLSIPHPVHKRIFGFTGLTGSMASSTQSVKVNNEARPGWKFANSPFVDGGAEGGAGFGDGVCFELFDSEGKKVFQWGGPLSFGNIVIK